MNCLLGASKRYHALPEPYYGFSCCVCYIKALCHYQYGHIVSDGDNQFLNFLAAVIYNIVTA